MCLKMGIPNRTIYNNLKTIKYTKMPIDNRLNK